MNNNNISKNRGVGCRVGDRAGGVGSGSGSDLLQYLWEWPAEENPPSPGGPCSGNYSFTCQTGAQNVWGEDPMARAKPPTDYIQAQCLLVILKGQAQFLRQDCAEPQPAYSKFIGVLPNGQCCYAVGATPDIIIAPTNAGYLIKLCEGVCDDDEF